MTGIVFLIVGEDVFSNNQDRTPESVVLFLSAQVMLVVGLVGMLNVVLNHPGLSNAVRLVSVRVRVRVCVCVCVSLTLCVLHHPCASCCMLLPPCLSSCASGVWCSCCWRSSRSCAA